MMNMEQRRAIRRAELLLHDAIVSLEEITNEGRVTASTILLSAVVGSLKIQAGELGRLSHE